MLMLIVWEENMLCRGLINLNTSHVNVNQNGLLTTGQKDLDLNTSHVNVNRITNNKLLED